MKTIFIIDDDNMYQMLLSRTIRKINDQLNIVSFTNGEEALEHFKELFNQNSTLPDLVLVDINMPVLDGWQFLDDLEIIRPGYKNEIPVYLISTSLDENDKNKAQENEYIRDFIIKPLPTEWLDEILKGL